MSQLAIRLSILVPAICAAALVVIPAVTPAEASGKHIHIKKHARHWRHHYGAAWSVGPAQPAAG